MRVLVVEDNVDLAFMLAALIKTCAASVRMAHTPEQALSTVVEWQPQIVFLDLGLPGEDGYQLAPKLREAADSADVHIVAVSGFGADKSKLAASGIDMHVLKPIGYSTIKEIVDRSHAEPDSRPLVV